MRYLVDTDYLSILQLRTGPEFAVLSVRVAHAAPADLALSIVSFHEQVLGAQTFLGRARHARDVVRGYRLLAEILRGFSAAAVLPFDEEAGAAFDRLRSEGFRVATMDLRIAAIAISRGLTLLTRNARDVSRVPGLSLDDWTVSGVGVAFRRAVRPRPRRAIGSCG